VKQIPKVDRQGGGEGSLAVVEKCFLLNPQTLDRLAEFGSAKPVRISPAAQEKPFLKNPYFFRTTLNFTEVSLIFNFWRFLLG